MQEVPCLYVAPEPPEERKRIAMKLQHLLRSLCAVFLASALALSAVPGLADGQIRIRVTSAGSINLRAQPTAASQSLGLFPGGTPVDVDYVTSNGNWAHLTVEGRTGFMSTYYLEGDLTPYYTAVSTPVYTAPQEPAVSALIPPPMITEDTLMYVYTGNTGRLHLREYASQNARSLGLYATGTQVHVLARTGLWAYVNVNGALGYMMLQYLTTTTPAAPVIPTPAPIGTPVTMYISTGNSGRLHLREYASQNARSLGLYPNGTALTAINLYNGWCYVNVNGAVGYMMTKYLTTYAPVTPVPAPTTGTLMYVSTGNTGRLHLRANMSMDSASLGLYPNGTQVYVLTDYGTWAYVYVMGNYGYMMTHFLTSVTPGPTTPVTPVTPAPIGSATVVHPNGSFVYLRSSRSTDDLTNVLAKVPSGAVVEVFEQDQWYSKIRYNGMVGYMVTHYLYSGAVPTTPTTPTVPVVPTPTLPTPIGSATVWHPNGSFVYLRSTRSTADTSNVIAKVPSGAVVELLQQDEWYSLVRYNSMVGYMVTHYLYTGSVPTAKTLSAPAAAPAAAAPAQPAKMALTAAPASEPAAAPVAGGKAVVRNQSSAFVYLRSSRSTVDTSNILAQVPNGAVVDVLETDSTWSRIKYRGMEGYMMTAFLKAE